MDLYEAQTFMSQMYPGKKLTFEFDDNCHRFIEIVHTDGLPHTMHHVECRKVKVNIEGQDSIYIPIAPHRITTTWKAVLNYVNSKNDVHINDDQLTELSNLKRENPSEFSDAIKKYCEMTGFSPEQIEKKVK